MILILFFIILLNIVAIVLTYYCLEHMEKKEKVIFIAVGIAVIYILTSLVYWISTKNIEIKAVSETGKNLITFMFVPINAIFVLPILAKSYRAFKIGKLKSDKFRNRIIIFSVILAIILAIECAYFKEIQNGVVKMIENNQNKDNQKEVILNANDINMNIINEMAGEGKITFLNEEGKEEVLSNETVNGTLNQASSDEED